MILKVFQGVSMNFFGYLSSHLTYVLIVAVFIALIVIGCLLKRPLTALCRKKAAKSDKNVEDSENNDKSE